MKWLFAPTILLVAVLVAAAIWPGPSASKSSPPDTRAGVKWSPPPPTVSVVAQDSTAVAADRLNRDLMRSSVAQVCTQGSQQCGCIASYVVDRLSSRDVERLLYSQETENRALLLAVQALYINGADSCS